MSVMTTLILVAAGLVGATGLILGLFLGVASENFKVEVDEREAEVLADFRAVTVVQRRLLKERLP